jgi:RNA polymerase sigma-70 factor (ECF subfamily)
VKRGDADLLDHPEHVLLQRAQGGEDEAFGELQAELEPAARRFIRRLIGMSDAEDDIVQDVFIALYRNLNRIEPVEKLRPYVFRMIRNRCYDELRRLGRFQAVSLDDEPLEAVASLQAPPEGQPEEVAYWLMLYVEVQEAMERLPELQRQALILYSEENLSYAEIADVMNCSVGTVKSRLYYAKKTMRQLVSVDTLAALDGEFGRGTNDV